MSSIVYPRDEVRFPEAVHEAGLTSYRSTGESWHFRSTGKPRRLGRLAHTLDQLVGRPAPLATVRGHGPVAIGSSGILTLRSGLRRRIPYRVIRSRFIKPLHEAAASRGLYHLWTHPWNLALPDSDALILLEDVCATANLLVERWDLQVLTMAEVARLEVQSD